MRPAIQEQLLDQLSDLNDHDKFDLLPARIQNRINDGFAEQEYLSCDSEDWHEIVHLLKDTNTERICDKSATRWSDYLATSIPQYAEEIESAYLELHEYMDDEAA